HRTVEHATAQMSGRRVATTPTGAAEAGVDVRRTRGELLMMSLVVDRLPVTQATVALRSPRSRHGSPACLSVPRANSDHSFRAGTAFARGTPVRLAGRREVARRR